MSSVAWPLLVIAVLFLGVGAYFIVGRVSVADSARLRREQTNKIRPANRQLPPSRVSGGQILGAGIALAVIGVLWVVVFILSAVH